MAKYVVLRTFTDKETNEPRKRGYVYDYTDKRAKEILKVGKLIEKVTPEVVVNPAVDTTAITIEPVDESIEEIEETENTEVE